MEGIKQCQDYTEFASDRKLYAAAHARHMCDNIKVYFKKRYEERLNNMPWPANKDD